MAGDPVPFALFYSIGNVLSLCSTAFLVGPFRQIKNMGDKNRIVASLIYLFCIAGTLVCVFLKLSDGTRLADHAWGIIIILIFIVAQFVALMWYVMSYVPFGRKCLKSCVGKCCSCPV